MSIDFSPLISGEMKPLEVASNFSKQDLRDATNSMYDAVLDIVGDKTDAQLTFDPSDPGADDPYAADEADREIAWNLAHLVLHVTASCEEGAAFSSLLARGIPMGGRLRYEPDWRPVTTREQVLHRLEESRRMCLAYLETWPDEPHLDVYRDVSERLAERFGQFNAPAAYLFGLFHLAGHMEQIRDAAQQALAAQ